MYRCHKDQLDNHPSAVIKAQDVNKPTTSANHEADVLKQRILANTSRQCKAFSKDVIKDECRTVRLFISSTFKDFYSEREILVKQILPRLRELCEKSGLFLVECDLRWGVPKHATGDEAIVACLGEIQRSVEETDGFNFFLGLVGDRYGWAPSEDEIAPHIRQRFDWIDGASVTLMEIVNGILRTQSPFGLIMCRTDSMNFVSKMPAEYQDVFVEKNPNICEKVSMVKDFLRSTLSESGRFHEYSCQFDGVVDDPVTKKKRVQLIGFEQFEMAVSTFFEECIKDLATAVNSKVGDRLQDEHYLLMRLLLHSVSVEVELLDDLKALITDSGKGNSFLYLVGEAGCGKSTMMAAFIRFLLRLFGDKNIFYHFCGASAASKSETNILERLRQFTKQYSPGNGGDLEDATTFPQLLQRLSAHGEVVNQNIYVILDALDEVSTNSSWDWLQVADVPKNVYLIVSCLKQNGILQQHLSEAGAHQVLIPPMKPQQATQFVVHFFHEYGKSLSESELSSLTSHSNATNPLWLSLSCEELRIHGDYSSLTKVIAQLPEDIDSLYKQILSRLIAQQRRSISEDLYTPFLRCLLCSRSGMWESEANQMVQFVTSRESAIPNLHFSDMLRNLRTAFIHVTGVPYPVIKLRHRIGAQVLSTVVFDTENTAVEIHRRLSMFYQTMITNQGLDQRRQLEMVFHYYKAGMRSNVIHELTTSQGRHYFNIVQKSRLLNQYRCGMLQSAVPMGNKTKTLRVCQMCLGARQQTPHAPTCYYCGMMVTPQTSVVTCMCQLHSANQLIMSRGFCHLCKRTMPESIVYDLKLCRMCDGVGNFCCVLVDENDKMFRQTARQGGWVQNLDSLFYRGD